MVGWDRFTALPRMIEMLRKTDPNELNMVAMVRILNLGWVAEPADPRSGEWPPLAQQAFVFKDTTRMEPRKWGRGLGKQERCEGLRALPICQAEQQVHCSEVLCRAWTSSFL